MRLIREARPQEAEAISALALRSKAYWKYDVEALAVFRRELTLLPDDVLARNGHVLEDDGQILGFYTLLGLGQAQVELEHIFVEPSHIRMGIGRALFGHACDLVSAVGGRTMLVKSDPHATNFYAAIGATFAGNIPSSLPGRTIPTFVFDV